MLNLAYLEQLLGLLAALVHSPQAGAPAPAPHPPSLSDEDLIALADSAAEIIVVTDDAPAESASSVHLDREALRLRPRTQPSDLLRQVPGLAVSQHAGGGKSDQYFIRGFDADHGTDVAIFADGVPVNLTSHGHGQGYADTHWLIPETIERLDMHKGPYAARYGDFYTAGALELKTIEKVDGATVWIAGGSPVTTSTLAQRYDRRVVGMASPRIRDAKEDTSLLALQIAENDGPFIAAQDFRQGNALVKWKGRVGPGTLGVAGTWYSGSWNQSGQIPEREVASGRLDRFGSLDPTEGGIATRSSLQLDYTLRDASRGSTFRVMGYGVSNDLELYSNFTLYARDAEQGDQIGQTDDRLLYGFDTRYERRLARGGMDGLITTGVQFRADNVETSLLHASRRKRLPMCFGDNANPCNHTDNSIRNLAAFAEAKLAPLTWLHLRPGLRADGFSWHVNDLDPETNRNPVMTTGGAATASIVSPKLSIEIHQSKRLTLFVNGGSGFHSNDARSVVANDSRGALARAIGGEVGARVRPHERVRVAADVWHLSLTSEQVWSGDLGGTEASNPTRRFGVDVESSIAATPWLLLDGNVTWARATFVANRGNGGALALAPSWMGSGGASVHDDAGFISVRARGIADRAGNQDETLIAEGYLLFDVIAGKRLGSFTLELTVANLLDTRWREAQFAEESRVAPTAPLVEQMHFTPGIPLTTTFKAAYSF